MYIKLIFLSKYLIQKIKLKNEFENLISNFIFQLISNIYLSNIY